MHVVFPDLCCTNDGFASRVAASDHHLLGDEDFLCRDLNPQVAPGNHHAIALSQDLLKTDREIRGGNEEDSEFGMEKKRELEKSTKERVSRDEEAEAERTKIRLFASVHHTEYIQMRVLSCKNNVNKEQQERVNMMMRNTASIC